MTPLVLPLWTLLLLKVSWNAVLFISLIVFRSEKSEGVSIMPYVEGIFLILLTAAAWLSVDTRWWQHWPTVLAIGSGSIVLSYSPILLGLLVKRSDGE